MILVFVRPSCRWQVLRDRKRLGDAVLGGGGSVQFLSGNRFLREAATARRLRLFRREIRSRSARLLDFFVEAVLQKEIDTKSSYQDHENTTKTAALKNRL